MGFFSFFDRFRASSDRSPYGDFWFDPVSARTSSGLRVSADSALRLSAVYACVRILSETLAMLPFVLYRQRPDGGKDRITDHWLYTLLAKRPNRWQNAFEWREMMQGHLALRGNAYNQIVSNPRTGEISELLPVHPDRIRIEMLDNGDYRYRLTDRAGGSRPIPRGEIWHLRGLSSDGLLGISPIELARENFGSALAAQDYGARFFVNDAKPSGGWVEFPGSFKDKAARDVFRESFQAAQSGANRGKMLVLESGMKYHEVGVTNRDAQFLELRKFQITDVARVFRVPPHMIADLERATFSNIEQQSLDFIMHTMTPWAERWEASIEADLLFDDSGLEVEFDFANLMRGDRAARAAYYHSGILDGWLTRNEARIAENLNPIEGLDEPLRPLNMVEESWAEDNEGEIEPGDAALPAPKESDGEEVQDAAAHQRLRALVTSNARRLARRVAKSGDIDAEVIADAMAVSVDAARHWQRRQLAGASEDEIAASLMELTDAVMDATSD
jgi:HK97 family phage portal protein